MWADICVANQKALRLALGELLGELRRLDVLISSGDRKQIVEKFMEVRALHRSPGISRAAEELLSTATSGPS